MKRRRRLLAWIILPAFAAALLVTQPQSSVTAQDGSEQDDKIKVAGITTVYRQNSHSDVQLGRLIQGYNLDGTGDKLDFLELASLYTDQVPSNDISRALARRYLFPIYDTVEEALTLGTGELAVDAVYLCLEHGSYPLSPSGNREYPKRRLFEEVVQVFQDSGRVVPVFMDKHISDNWEDAKWIYDTAQEMGIPLMAGSSLPVAWRSPWQSGRPAPDVPRGSNLEEVFAVSQTGLDGGTFHALEFMQSLVERRAGGETGISAVQGLRGNDVWDAADDGVYDKELLVAALNRASHRHWTVDDFDAMRSTFGNPTLWIIEYADGLKASVLTASSLTTRWTVSWRYDRPDRAIESVQSELHARPFNHHALLVENVAEMFKTGEPVYPAERTLLVSGALNELLISRNLENSARLETPHLEFSYQSDWDWEQPDPPPPVRTLATDFPSNFPWHLPASYDEAADIVDARHSEGALTSEQRQQLLQHLGTAERAAERDNTSGAHSALDRFDGVASGVADGQAREDLLLLSENLRAQL